MVVLNTDDVVLTGLVTFLACFQMGQFASSVGKARKRHKISPPAIDGDPAFVRIFRAQQNCIEFFGMFLGVLWVASIFCNQYLASLAGLLYMYGRQKYFDGYYRDAKDRVPGFYLSVRGLMALSAMAICGLAQSIILLYFGFNLKAFAFGLGGLKL